MWSESSSLSTVNLEIKKYYSSRDNEFSLGGYFFVSQKKRTNFETVWLKIMWIDFDDIWQNYSTDTRIESACFSFHVGLLVITLSSLKLHTENNACMLCASISC